MFYNADDENVYGLYSMSKEPTRKELMAIEKENKKLDSELSESCKVVAWWSEWLQLNNPNRILEDIEVNEGERLKAERFDILGDLKDSRAVVKSNSVWLKKKIYAKKSIKYLQDELARVRSEEKKYWAEVFA